MKSLWNDAEAREVVRRYSGEHGEDLALRVYTARLIGADPLLVLHGGGNVSVKTTMRSVLEAREGPNGSSTTLAPWFRNHSTHVLAFFPNMASREL